MARIELRDAVITLKDGFAGTAAVNDVAGVAVSDTTVALDTVATNAVLATDVPVGARFTLVGDTTIYTVTAVDSPGTPATLTFTPAATSISADDSVITFLPQQVEIKLGDGDLSWTKNRDFEYLLDRGDLDSVREGDQQPLDVNIDAVYEHITTGTSEVITPYDALNKVGGAAAWVSSAADACEPYAVDVEVAHAAPCGSSQDETTLLADFRYESFDVSLRDAAIVVSGRCNTVSPVITRS